MLGEYARAGVKNISVKLASDASDDMLTVFRTALDSEDIADGSINLTVSGVTAIPDYFLGYYDNGLIHDEFEYHLPVDKLRTVSLPNVTSIGKNAFFYCSTLESVDAPCLTAVGDCAFVYCIALKSIDLSLVTHIGNDGFEYCSALTSLDLPLLTSVGWDAFECCEGLESIKFGALTEISDQMLMSCRALSTITFERVITSVGNGWLNNVDPSQGITLILAHGQSEADGVELDLTTNTFSERIFKEIIISPAE